MVIIAMVIFKLLMVIVTMVIVSMITRVVSIINVAMVTSILLFFCDIMGTISCETWQLWIEIQQW